MKKDYQENNQLLNDFPIEKSPASDLYFYWDLFKIFVIVFVVAFSIRYFLVKPFIVEGGSMLPTFVDDEYLLAEKLSYFITDPKRGDVIIFKYPNNPSQSYIKRIIALPGETVKIKNNDVTIINSQYPDGVIVNENYIPQNIQTITPQKEGLNQSMKSDEYFVMGDNREHSSDSREWGILPKENIIGRAWITIKPLDHFGLHKKIDYPDLSGIITSLALSTD